MAAMARIHTIVTHHRPHFDEIVAIFLLQQFGYRTFPGIRSAEFIFWDAGSAPADGRTAAEWEQDGYLCIGVGHGRFDEHPTPDRPRLDGQCAASLVANAINCSKRKDVHELIAYATENDTQGNVQKAGPSGKPSPFMLAPVVGYMNSAYPNDPQRVIRWTLQALQAHAKQAADYHYQGPKLFETARVIPLDDAAKATLAVVKTDNEQAWRFGWTQRGGRHAVILCQRSSGQMQIFTNRQFGFNLDQLAVDLRIGELTTRGPVEAPPSNVLRSEGTLPLVPEWHYFSPAMMIFNGSLTAPNTPVTSLTVDKVAELIIKNLGEQVSPKAEVTATTPLTSIDETSPALPS